MAKLLGIDIGTSGCKVLLIDELGRVLKQAAAEYPLSIPKPMWAEQNPEDWWTGVQKCLAEIGEPRPDAIGLTGQMHGAVFLDAKMEVVRPAILWNDQRTTEECEEIANSVGLDRLMRVTCNPPLTGFQLPKILWLRNHELSGYQRLRHVLLPKDYIRWKLTGELATEVSDASGTGAFDVPNRRWSQDVLGALEVDAGLFPACSESANVTAKTAEGVPVVGGGGDQAAAAVGTGAVKPGIVSVSLGTSGVVFTAVDRPEYDPAGAAHTFCHANGGWHSMGVMLSCGGALRWFRDVFHSGGGYDEIAASADTSPAGAGGITFLPYLTGERCPYNDPFAKAAFAGLSLGHTKADISRAVFEGISFGLLDCLNLLIKLGANVGEIRVTSGGSRSPFWLQMLSDVFNAPCTTLEVDEGPAFGAAILAGVGIGLWSGVATAADAVVRRKSIVQPRGIDYQAAYGRYRELYALSKPWSRL
jgi:xylulokinase